MYRLTKCALQGRFAMWNALIKYNSLAAPVLLADHSGYGASHELRSMLANQRAVRYDNKRTVYSSIID